METKLVEAYFVQKETFYHSFEVPVDMPEEEIKDYIKEQEEHFWNVARSCQDISTELDEVSTSYSTGEEEELRESGDYLSWELDEDETL